MPKSKALGSDDVSGYDFVKEILKGDPTCAINFYRLQKHPKRGYIIFELLLCEEAQSVNPHTSDPRRYLSKNSQKFISLYSISQDLDTELFLVNYAKKGTKHDEKIKVIKVLDLDNTGILKEKIWNTN